MVDRFMLQFLAKSFHVILEVIPLRLVLLILIGCSNIALSLLQHPNFVESDDSSLELLEVLFF